MAQTVDVTEFARIFVKDSTQLPAGGDNRLDPDTDRFYFRLDFDALQKAETPVADVLKELRKRYDVEVVHRIETPTVVKERRYVQSPDDVPDGYKVEQGPHGGTYYETNPTNVPVASLNASDKIGYDGQPVYAVLADHVGPGDEVAFEREDGTRDVGEVVEASDGSVRVQTGDGELEVQPAPFSSATAKSESGGDGGTGTVMTSTEGVHNTRYSPEEDDEKEEDLEAVGDVAKADDGNWVSYVGPEGGEGWLNLQTCEVRYQAERPGDGVEGYEEEPWHDGWDEYSGDLASLSVGDQVQYTVNDETKVATVDIQNVDETGKVHLDDGYYFDENNAQFTDIQAVSAGETEEADDGLGDLPPDEYPYTELTEGATVTTIFDETGTVIDAPESQSDVMVIQTDDGSELEYQPWEIDDVVEEAEAEAEPEEESSFDWQTPVDYDPEDGWDLEASEAPDGSEVYTWASHGAEIGVYPEEFQGEIKYEVAAGQEGDPETITANLDADEIDEALENAAWIMDHMTPAQVKQIGHQIDANDVFNKVYEAYWDDAVDYDGSWVHDQLETDVDVDEADDGDVADALEETEPEAETETETDDSFTPTGWPDDLDDDPEPEPETETEAEIETETSDIADPSGEGGWTAHVGDYDVTAFDENDIEEWGSLGKFGFPSGVSGAHMDVGITPGTQYDDPSEVENKDLVFRRKFGDDALDPETGHRQMVAYTIGAALGGQMPTHAGHAEEDGHVVANGVNGYDIGSAPAEVLNQVDEDQFIQQAAVQIILGNNDAHHQNVKLTPDGDVVFHDIDHAAGDISSDFVGQKPYYDNALDRVLGELYRSASYVVDGDEEEVKQRMLEAAVELAQEHQNTGAGTTDEGYETFAECVDEESDKDDPEAFCASIFFGGNGDNELAQALQQAVGYSPELVANVQNNIQNLAQGNLSWQ